MLLPNARRRISHSRSARLALSAALAAVLSFGCRHASTKLEPERVSAFLVAYADVASASYGAALSDARTLATSVDAFVRAPSADSLQAARRADIGAQIVCADRGVPLLWRTDRLGRAAGEHLADRRELPRVRRRKNRDRRRRCTLPRDFAERARRPEPQRGRNQRQHRLSRNRVPALGARPQRDWAR